MKMIIGTVEDEDDNEHLFVEHQHYDPFKPYRLLNDIFTLLIHLSGLYQS